MLKRIFMTGMAVFPMMLAADANCDNMDIEFDHPYAQVMSHDYVDLALYVAIVNKDNVPQTLVRVSSPGAGQGAFYSYYGPRGPQTLQPLTNLTIPAGGEMVFQSGDNHIRLLNYPNQTRPNGGDQISVTFSFANGCSKTVDGISVHGGVFPSN